MPGITPSDSASRGWYGHIKGEASGSQKGTRTVEEERTLCSECDYMGGSRRDDVVYITLYYIMVY